MSPGQGLALFAWTRGCGAGRLLACLPMLISFACMSEKVPGETCLPFPGGGPICDCGLELGWVYLGSQALSLGGNLWPPFLLFCLSALWGAWLCSLSPLHSYPATSESWLAPTTGNSLASTQTQASACPSGSLSLSTQSPPGPGSRSGRSGLSSVPEPDGQSAYRITASPGPRPPPPMVGPGSCLGSDGEAPS